MWVFSYWTEETWSASLAGSGPQRPWRKPTQSHGWLTGPGAGQELEANMQPEVVGISTESLNFPKRGLFRAAGYKYTKDLPWQ